MAQLLVALTGLVGGAPKGSGVLLPLPATLHHRPLLAHPTHLAQPPTRAHTTINMLTDAPDEDESLGAAFRLLGISEDAQYDEITDAFIELSELYASDAARVAALEAAKEKILDLRLKQRMAGSLKPTVADSPWDAKPIERIPPWVYAREFLEKVVEFPSAEHAVKVVALLATLTVSCWFSPGSAGGVLMVNCVAGTAFVYNRGTPPVARDDNGQIGEVRPTRVQPLAAAIACTTAVWLMGNHKAKQWGAAAQLAPAVTAVLRTTLISFGIMLNALFLKTQTLFD